MHYARGALAHVVWGAFLGALFGALYFVVEPMLTLGDLRTFFGVSVLEVFTVYVAFGLTAGVASGVLLAIVRGRRKPDGALVFALLGAGVSTMYVLREVTIPELRALPWKILAVVALTVCAWGIVAWVGERSGRFRLRLRGRGLMLVFLAAIAPVLLPALVLRAQDSRLPTRSGAGADAPNVVMIVVDAMRRDHLGAYGYPRPTSPTMDRLAREGVRFDNAYSQGNRTIIAMPSLFTSLYPSFHGAIGFSNGASPLPDSRVTVAELFQGAGYRTVGLMSNVYLKRPFGLTQGFDRTEEFDIARFYLSVYRVLNELGLAHKPPQKATTASATEVTDAALEWLQRLRGAPYFLYVHYMDVHHPYIPPDRFIAEFDRGSATTGADRIFADTVRLLKMSPPLTMPDAERERLIDFYDACIRYTDSEIARIVSAVTDTEDGRPTIIVLTSDHGDEFFEQGSVYHNNLLIEPLIRVPLIFWSSDGAWEPRVVDGMSRHVDVLPTLAEVIGATPPSQIVGTSLLASLTGGSRTGVERSVSEGDYCAAINTPQWKIMYVDSSASFYLYDLSSDRDATRDVSDVFPARFDSLRAELDGYMSAADKVRQSADETVSEETLRQLRALGYVR